MVCIQMLSVHFPVLNIYIIQRNIIAGQTVRHVKKFVVLHENIPDGSEGPAHFGKAVTFSKFYFGNGNLYVPSRLFLGFGG